MLKEFKEFALKGNVVDLAIGIVIGAAFSRIINSFVEDIIMPPVSLLFGDIDFSNRFINLGSGSFRTLAEAKAAGAPTLNYGLFTNHVITFLLVAFILFLIIKQVNRMRNEPETASPDVRSCPFCLSSIPRAATRCASCTSQVSVA